MYKSVALDLPMTKDLSTLIKKMPKEDCLHFIRVLGALKRTKSSDLKFERLFRRLAHLKNQSVADIQLIEEFYRIHFDLFKFYFKISDLCQEDFEASIKNGYEQLLAFKLYASELQGKFAPLHHLMKNHKSFFTHKLDDVSIKGLTILMNEYAKNPKQLVELATVKQKFTENCFSSRDERLLTIEPDFYTLSELVQLSSCFLLLNHANLEADFADTT